MSLSGTSKPVYLGLDLAWSAQNLSGLAALDARGVLVDLRWDGGDDADVLAWVRAHLNHAGPAVLAIDMPTIVPNATGARSCERALNAVYRGADAGAHPSNRANPCFADGGRAARLIAALRADAVIEDPHVARDDARRVALEIYPHPAAVELFGLQKTLKYKRKRGTGRPDHRAEWVRYRGALDRLTDPPLHLPEALLPRAPGAPYKRYDDMIDAVFCAYIGRWLRAHGTPAHGVFGTLADGYIVVPRTARAARV